MPPLPTSEAEALVSGVRRRLHDVRTYQLDRLRGCQGPVDLHRELAEEMRTDLETAYRNIQVARELGERSRAGREDILAACDDLDEEYRSLKISYRDAVVQSKRAIASSQKRRHDLLATSSSNGEVPPEKLKAKPEVGMGEDDALQTKTNEVTDALRRTTTLMQAELERSVLSVQMLEESTRTLTSTHALYDTYTSILHTSGQLVRAIEKADWYDRLLIFSAFGLFLLVVAYVIKRRVLDRVVGGVAGGLGWWIGGSVRLVRMGLGGAGEGAGGGALAGVDGGGVSGGLGSVERGKTTPGQADAGSVLDVVPDEKTGSSAVSPGETPPDEQLQDPSPPIRSAVASPHRDES